MICDGRSQRCRIKTPKEATSLTIEQSSFIQHVFLQQWHMIQTSHMPVLVVCQHEQKVGLLVRSRSQRGRAKAQQSRERRPHSCHQPIIRTCRVCSFQHCTKALTRTENDIGGKAKGTCRAIEHAILGGHRNARMKSDQQVGLKGDFRHAKDCEPRQSHCRCAFWRSRAY